MKQVKKTQKFAWQQGISVVFMLLTGVICGFIIVGYLDKSPQDAPLYQEAFSILGLLLGMYLAIFFHTIVHEAGHLIFGLMTGYKFCSFRIHSFMWLKENGKIKFKRLSLAGTGGQCLMAPPNVKDGKLPLVLYNLGGSVLNIAVSALFFTVYLLLPNIIFLSPLLLVFALIGLMTAMLNGIPMRLGTVDNDGYNAFASSRSKEAANAFWIQLKIAEQSSRGIRIKDMPKEWFTVPSDESMKNSMIATQCVFACNRLLDEEKFEEADGLITHLLEIESGIIGLHHDLLVCEKIYLELIGKNRKEIIEGMMTKEQKRFMKSMKQFPSVLRVQYALALILERDPSMAEKIKSDFEKAAKAYPYPHEIDSERDLMRIADEIFKKTDSSYIVSRDC